MTKYESLIPRFISYVKKNTRSNAESTTIPSTQSQVEFAKDLMAELKEIGMQDVRLNKQSGYVFATLPSNLPAGKTAKKIGFISHMDTADFNAENVKPQVIENYDGESDIKLGDSEYTLSPSEFPNLHKSKNHTLITTSGDTLLGADDKCGITDIMTAMEYLVKHPEIKHGEIEVGFGPDEEIGTGADHFDTNDFGADIAYTVDGGPLGELEYETFNAAQAKITFKGKDVHPATAKGVMINALKLAMQFDSQLPQDEVPEKTEGREGFFLLLSLNGEIDEAHSAYIIRDHDRQKFEARKQLMLDIAKRMNDEFGEERVIIDMNDQYYNMREVIEKDMTVVDIAKEAMEDLQIKPDIYPVRGGTDGSKISFMGIPTPNIFTGADNMHSRFEFADVDTMEKAVDVIIKMVELIGEKEA
ncbi:peptidase T [Ligilactobacillus cholophilus]|uniref:peptidase T n=1 Tax=Ligilactobacillus cholophilus TaxID=3050131 RepID=UPI0025B0DCEB|nr:peptidase T [Ligilactobacillus cholophilus]